MKLNQAQGLNEELRYKKRVVKQLGFPCKAPPRGPSEMKWRIVLSPPLRKSQSEMIGFFRIAPLQSP